MFLVLLDLNVASDTVNHIFTAKYTERYGFN